MTDASFRALSASFSGDSGDAMMAAPTGRGYFENARALEPALQWAIKGVRKEHPGTDDGVSQLPSLRFDVHQAIPYHQFGLYPHLPTLLKAQVRTELDVDSSEHETIRRINEVVDIFFGWGMQNCSRVAPQLAPLIQVSIDHILEQVTPGSGLAGHDLTGPVLTIDLSNAVKLTGTDETLDVFGEVVMAGIKARLGHYRRDVARKEAQARERLKDMITNAAKVAFPDKDYAEATPTRPAAAPPSHPSDHPSVTARTKQLNSPTDYPKGIDDLREARFDPVALHRQRLRGRQTMPNGQFQSIVLTEVMGKYVSEKPWGYWWRYMALPGRVLWWTTKFTAGKVLLVGRPVVRGLTPQGVVNVVTHRTTRWVAMHLKNATTWALYQGFCGVRSFLRGDCCRRIPPEKRVRELWTRAQFILSANDMNRAGAYALPGALDSRDFKIFGDALKIAQKHGLDELAMGLHFKIAQCHLARRLTRDELNTALSLQIGRDPAKPTRYLPDLAALKGSLRTLDKAVIESTKIIRIILQAMVDTYQQVSAAREQKQDAYTDFRARFIRLAEAKQTVAGLGVVRRSTVLKAAASKIDSTSPQAAEKLLELVQKAQLQRGLMREESERLRGMEEDLQLFIENRREIGCRLVDLQTVTALEQLIHAIRDVFRGMQQEGLLEYFEANPRVIEQIRQQLVKLTKVGRIPAPFDQMLKPLPLLADTFYLRATASERMAEILRFGYEQPLGREHRQLLIHDLAEEFKSWGLKHKSAEELYLMAYKDYAFAEHIAAVKESSLQEIDDEEKQCRFLDDEYIHDLSGRHLKARLKDTLHKAVGMAKTEEARDALRREEAGVDGSRAEEDEMRKRIDELRWEYIYSYDLPNATVRGLLSTKRKRCKDGMARSFAGVQYNPLISRRGYHFLEAYGKPDDPVTQWAKGNWAYNSSDEANAVLRYQRAVDYYKQACRISREAKSKDSRKFTEEQEKQFKEFSVSRYRAVNMLKAAEEIAAAHDNFRRHHLKETATHLQHAVNREERAIEAGLLREGYTEAGLESLLKRMATGEQGREILALHIRREQVRMEASFNGLGTNLPWLYATLADVYERLGQTGAMKGAEDRATKMLSYVQEKEDYKSLEFA